MAHAADVSDGEEPEAREKHPAPRRYGTPTGEPCPRTLRADGTVEGTGECHGCGSCLLGTGLV